MAHKKRRSTGRSGDSRGAGRSDVHEVQGVGESTSQPDEVLSYWFPEEDLWSGDRETFGRWMRWWFAGGPEVDRDHRAVRGLARAGKERRTGSLGPDTAGAARAHRRPRPVLPQRLQGLSPLLRPGPEGPGARYRRHRGGDGPGSHPHGADILLDAPRALRGSGPPRTERPSRPGCGERGPEPPPC